MAAKIHLYRQWVWPALVVSLLLAFAASSMRAPAAISASASDTEFSAERAMSHVAALAAEPRPVGSPANDVAERYIMDQLDLLGWDVSTQTTTPDIFRRGSPVEVTNVIGSLAGVSSSGSIVLIAHYDSDPKTPGANDNAAAVGALLETARALGAGPAVGNDITLLFSDGEEPEGRFGATAFLADRTLSADAAMMVNLEAAGGSGPALLAEVSGPQDWMISELAASTAHPVGTSALTATTDLLGDIGTDFDPFSNAGIAGFHFAYMRGGPIYHTAADDIAAVSVDSLQHHGSLALGIARHFGDLDLSEATSDGAREDFFSIGPWFIHYSAALTTLGLAVMGLGLTALVVVRRKRGQPAGAVFTACGRLAGVVLAATALGTLIWIVVGTVRPSLGVAESYVYLAGIVGALAMAARLVLQHRWAAVSPLAAVGLWLVFAGLAAAWLPGAAYMFVWPALVAAGVLLAEAAGRVLAPMARLVLVAAPATLLSVPVIDSFFLLAQPRPGNPDSSMLFAAAVPILLALLLVMLIAAFWPTSRPNVRPDLGQVAPLPTHIAANSSLVSSSSS